MHNYPHQDNYQNMQSPPMNHHGHPPMFQGPNVQEMQMHPMQMPINQHWNQDMMPPMGQPFMGQPPSNFMVQNPPRNIHMFSDQKPLVGNEQKVDDKNTPVDPSAIKKNWQVHKDEHGRKFYYNSVTDFSTYDKPDCLKSQEELNLVCKWKEYADDNGNKYWHNFELNQSVWDEPFEHKEYKRKVEEIEKRLDDEERIKEEKAQARARKNSQKVVQQVIHYSTKDEALEAFYSLLNEQNLPKNPLWKDIVKSIQIDPRFNALKTTGERKQAFSEWCGKKIKMQREVKIKKSREIKDNLDQLLEEHRKQIALNNTVKSIFYLVGSDPRFTIFQTREEKEVRDEIINDFVENLDKQLEIEKLHHIEEVKKNYFELLSEKEILSKQTYPEVVNILKGDIRHDQLDQDNAIYYFNKYIRDLKNREKEERERAVKAKEAAFNKFMDNLLNNEGDVFNSDLPYSEFNEKYSQNDEYKSIDELPGTSISSLYDTYIRRLNIRNYNDMELLIKYIDNSNLKLNETVKYNEFKNLIDTTNERYNILKDLMETNEKRVIKAYEGLIKDLAIKNRKKEEMEQKRKDKFIQLLKHYFYKEKHLSCTYENAKDKMRKRSVWDELPTDIKKQLFDEHIRNLSASLKQNRQETRGEVSDNSGDEQKMSNNKDKSINNQHNPPTNSEMVDENDNNVDKSNHTTILQIEENEVDNIENKEKEENLVEKLENEIEIVENESNVGQEYNPEPTNNDEDGNEEEKPRKRRRKTDSRSGDSSEKKKTKQ